MDLREATASDLPSVARLHRSAYSSDHFLALLPETMLVDYYARFLDQGSRIVVATANTDAAQSCDELLGFAVFGRNIESRIEAFKRDRRWGIVRTALNHPVLAARKVLTAAGARRRTGPPHEPAPALLLSIAVGKTSSGIGRALLDDMLRRSAAAGEERIGLYVRYTNIAAINAYLRAGFWIETLIADQYYMERALAPETDAKGVYARRG